MVDYIIFSLGTIYLCLLRNNFTHRCLEQIHALNLEYVVGYFQLLHASISFCVKEQRGHIIFL